MMLTRQRVIRLLTIFLLSGWLVLFAASRIFILQSFETLEKETTITQINRVQGAIAEKLDTLSSKAGDWAIWDEPYNFVLGQFPEFVATELDDSTFIPLQVNLIILTDKSGKVVYAKSVDLSTNKSVPFEYANSIPLDQFIKNMDASSQLSGLVLLPNSPMLIAVNPILPSDGKGQPAGAFIFGRYLDGVELQRIASTTHLVVDVTRLDQPLSNQEQRLAQTSINDDNPNFVQAKDEQHINGYTVMKDIQGKPILLLRVQQPREIYKQGLTSVLYFMLAISVIGIIAAIVFFLLADRLIESRYNLRSSEEKYSVLFNQAAIPAVLVQLPENILADVNQAFEQTFGYSRQELLGKNWGEIGLLSPDEKSRIQTLSQNGILGNNSEIQLLKKSGDVLITPIKANVVEFGGRKYAIATIHDLTDRKRAEEQLQSLSRRLVEMQEAERRSLALELHDEIGQALTAVKMNLQATQFAADSATSKARLDESVRIVERTLRQTRDLSLDLRPSMLDDFGLVSAIEWYLKRETERSNLIINLSVEPRDLRLPAVQETTCYRIVQSAITNIVRHAQAKHVRVELHIRDSKRVELIIQDDGIGFDVAKAIDQARHGTSMGLLTMQERVQLIGGEIAFDSAPMRGTRIRATFQITE